MKTFREFLNEQNNADAIMKSICHTLGKESDEYSDSVGSTHKRVDLTFDGLKNVDPGRVQKEISKAGFGAGQKNGKITTFSRNDGSTVDLGFENGTMHLTIKTPK